MASPSSPSPDPDDHLAGLIPRAVGGDEDAMSELLFSQMDRLTAYVDRRLPPKLAGVISAEDIVQQTLVKAFQAIPRFEGSSLAAFAGWLNRIAHNQLTDYLRRRGNERLDASVKQPGEARQEEGSAWLRLSQMMDQHGETPMEAAMEAELGRAMQVALSALPENYRLAITLKHLQGKTMAEVAAAMDCTEDAARGVCHRARKQLKEELVRLSRFR